MQILDSINTELAGVNLIEAAAGTGKTYNIQNLAARLIVEKNFPINTLVIVTFTEKAAGELTERLRTVLESLLAVLQNRPCDNGEVDRVNALLQRFDSRNISREVQKERLEQALRDFDSNCVSTIHGFCAKVLQENAFESSVAFRVRIETEIQPYTDKLCRDFCRMVRYQERPLPGADDMEPQKFYNQKIRSLLRKDKLLIKNTVGEYDSADKLREYLDNIARQIAAENVDGFLDELQGKVNQINKIDGDEYLEICRQHCHSLKADELPAPVLTVKILKPMQTSKLLEVLKKPRNASPPGLAVMEKYSHILQLIDDYCSFSENECKLFLVMQGRKFVLDGLAEWKKRDNFQGYDDLIINLNKALKSPDRKLCNVLRSRYNAGIIDEFQDTDSMQYEIFDEIFIKKPDNPIFFMVGDPRQAIYSFRGGDLPAYLRAANNCPEEKKFALTTNFRSSAPMIRMFNEFFEHNSTFASNQITFHRVLNPDKPKPGMLYDGREIENPLKITYFTPDKDRNILPENQPAAACVRALAEMLSCGKYFLPGKTTPIEPGDIAILAHANETLDVIRAELQKFNIPVVGERKTGIWSSSEAQELSLLLQAILNSRNDSLLRQAMLSRFCGYTLPQLEDNIPENGDLILDCRLTFSELEKIWRHSGTASLMQAIFRIFNIKERMAPAPGGERFLANAAQLGDLLTAVEVRSKQPPRGIVKYLEDKIKNKERDDAAAEMLESDRSAVTLMTIHSSKGLQFPVVFLPELSSRYPNQYGGIKLYHEGYDICCNPDGLDNAAKLQATIEELQENLRLIYVAVTRACYYCHISWGPIAKKKPPVCHTPLDWLFRMQKVNTEKLHSELAGFLKLNSPDAEGEFVLPDVKTPCDTVDWSDLLDRLEDYRYIQDFSMELQAPPSDKVNVPPWFIASYSALPLGVNTLQQELLADDGSDNISDRDESDNLPGSDKFDNASDSGKAPKLTGGIWSITRGAAIGNAWHKLLEEADFQAGITLEETARVMSMYNFKSPEQHQAAHQMFERLLDYRLPCGLQLKNLSCNARLNELEFLLNSPQGFRLSDLCAAGEDYMLDEFGRAAESNGFFNMQGGFFTGFIDMVFVHNNKFYIVDWKSNSLDYDPAMFQAENLKQRLFEKNYQMQYLCYTAALVRHLEQQLNCEFTSELYEHYFGEVYYIFLRGLTLEPAAGVFSARPPFETVKAIADVITCGKREDNEND